MINHFGTYGVGKAAGSTKTNRRVRRPTAEVNKKLFDLGTKEEKNLSDLKEALCPDEPFDSSLLAIEDKKIDPNALALVPISEEKQIIPFEIKPTERNLWICV